MLVLFVIVAVTASVVLSTDTDTTCYNRFEYEYNVLEKLIHLEQERDSLNSTVEELKRSILTLTEQRRLGKSNIAIVKGS